MQGLARQQQRRNAATIDSWHSLTRNRRKGSVRHSPRVQEILSHTLALAWERSERLVVCSNFVEMQITRR